MINLIPPDAEKEVRKEYWIRVLSVWAFLLGSAFLIIALLNVPLYQLLASQSAAYQVAYTTASEQTNEFKNAEESIKNANTVATLLTQKTSRVAFSKVLETIEGLVPEGVTIESYSFTRKGDALSTISVAGTSATRASLSEFRLAIEGDPLFKTATLPLSDLAKDKNIPFSLSITPQSTTETP